MHPNGANRRVHSAEFKTQTLAACRQPGASVSAVAIARGLNPNVVRKWLAGHGLKRMGAAAAAPSPEVAVRGMSPALQFVPVELARSAPVLATPASQPDLRFEFHRGGLQVKLQCPPSAGALYAAQLRALADALCAA